MNIKVIPLFIIATIWNYNIGICFMHIVNHPVIGHTGIAFSFVLHITDINGLKSGTVVGGDCHILNILYH